MSPTPWLLALVVLVSGCGMSQIQHPPVQQVRAALASFHDAAATADFESYFELMREDSVFLGTDASERWSRAEFMEYARPHFQGDSAWVFRPVQQNVTFAADGRLAWFDELLDSESYGLCRDSGVMLRSPGSPGGWRIGQYNLTVPVPNALLKEVVARIREEDARRP